VTQAFRYYPLLASLVAHIAIPLAFGSLLVETSRFALASGSQGAGAQRPGAVSVQLVRLEQREKVVDAPQVVPVIQPVLPIAEKRPAEPKNAKKKIARQPKKVLPPSPQVTTNPVTAAVAQSNTAPTTTLPGPTDAGSESAASGTTTATPDYLRNPPPPYPRESRLSGEHGTVLLAVSLSSDGSVQSLAIKESSGFSRLDTAALQAVKSWKFRPAKLAGVSISSSIYVPVKFVLRS
jgi:protein TonB